MVHTVIVENRVESILKELLSSKQIQIGLLIGQATKSKDYVLLAVPTPSIEELNDSKETKEKSSSSFGGIEDWWVTEHAKQVINLLPGAVGVIGMFCVCPKETLPTIQPRLVKLLTDLLPTAKSTRPHNKATLLHYCTVTRRSKGQVIDVSEQLSGFRPAEVKYQTNPVQLVKVESVIRLMSDWCGELSGSTPQELLKSAQATVRPMVEKMLSQVLLRVNSHFVDEGDPLVPKTKKGEQIPTEETVKLDIFTRHSPQFGEDNEVLTDVRRVGMAGSLSLSAYLHPKASYGEALEAIKEDALRGLSSQFIALAESDSVQEISDGISTLLPSRVTVTVPNIPWTLSEYSLPNEDIEECESRVCELLGVSSATALPIKTFPTKPPLADAQTMLTDNRKISGQLWTLVAAVIVLIIAIASYALLF